VLTDTAQPPVIPTSQIANANAIKRYDDEVAANNDPLKVLWFIGDVRTEANGLGKRIATLRQGTQVQKLSSEKNVNFLVQFTSPKDPNKQLEGWVNSRVFSPMIFDAGLPHHIICPAGLVSFLAEDGTEYCERLCGTGGGAGNTCPAGETCTGIGTLVSTGIDVAYCIGGLPPEIDAGVTPVDAAAPPVDAAVPAAVDAATPPAQDAAPPCGKLPINEGKAPPCQLPYYANAGQCVLGCVSDGDCCRTPGAHCRAFGSAGLRACSAN
jgi:hypothetical protein